jgi:predicted glycosyltransferase
MKVLIDIGHPGHVHFFKHAVWELQKRGHEVFFSARDKDVTLLLLEHYKFNFQTLSEIGKGRFGLYREFIQREIALFKMLKLYKPDIVTGIGGEFITPVAKMLGIPSIVFTDSEPVPIDNILTYPIATAICTPACFDKDLGKRHIRYNGYHELAYLSPDYFYSDPTVLEEIGIEENEPFSILRFVAWKASHDIGQKGLSLSQKRKIVQTLQQYGRVFITSEKKLPVEFEPFRLNLPAHRVHDLIYYAQLFLGDGATMATEAAILGTPSVRSSSMALNMGNFVELMDRYELVYSYYEPKEALNKAVSILERSNSKQEWKLKRDQMLAEKINVTKFIFETLENYAKYAGV